MAILGIHFRLRIVDITWPLQMSENQTKEYSLWKKLQVNIYTKLAYATGFYLKKKTMKEIKGKYLSLHYMKTIAASNVLSALQMMTLNILENSTRCVHVHWRLLVTAMDGWMMIYSSTIYKMKYRKMCIKIMCAFGRLP